MSELHDIEAALRASLAEHARQAPAAEPVAAEIMTAIARSTFTENNPRARRWSTWTLPLIAAGSVAAVALGLVGVNSLHHSATHHAPAVSQSVNPPSPVTTAPTPPSTVTSTALPTVPVHLKNFVLRDLTFVSADHGWALGTADCLHGSGTCTAAMHTRDGMTWHLLPNPPVNIDQVNGCTSKCAQGIRFANDQIGYAYGHSVFFMTTDGGLHWTQQTGGADALETLSGNVIRVSTACSPGCPYRVQTAPIGTSVWHSVTLPGSQAGTNSGVALARTGHSAFIDIFGRVAGGASDARSVMYSSTDDGATWTRRGEPCPQDPGTEIDSAALTSAADGSVTLLCTPRGLANSFTITSTDAGQSFVRGTGGLNAQGSVVLGAASAKVLFVSSDALYRSLDGGQRWQRLVKIGAASWIGFETPTVGRLIDGGPNGARIVWTTRDAGGTWTSYSFG